MTSKKSKGKQKLINNNKSLPPMSPCPKGKRSVKVPKVIVEDVIDILDSEDDNKKEESNVHSGDDDVDSDYMAMDEDGDDNDDNDDDDGNDEDGDNNDNDGNDEDGDDNDNDGNDEDGLYIENNDVDFDDTISRKQKNYTVLSEEDIRHRQEEDITRICAVLSISRVSAAILLCNYNWSVSNVHDAWFADEENVRKTVGLVEKPVVQYPKSKKVTCGICFDNYRHQEMSSAACGHLFCSTCWKGYISTSINDGPGCLILRCPDPSCGVAVGQNMISILDSDEHKDKYSRYLLRSYVEANRKTKWCPAPGCEYAVDFVVGSGTYDVLCNCTYTFCWNCLEEGHRPVDCDTVSKWILKNSAESENVNWILANSKPCPKCKRPIEKNHGCMHMTCTPPCKFQFCWLCLGSWTDHGNRTGGYYSCNRYAAAKKDGEYEESEKRREMAKKSLERYTHYYERWATNHSSRLKAVGNLQEMQTVHIEKLIDEQCQLKSQLKFITDAWLQIIECRRVLKWTYAYGYYLPEQEDVKRNFFEYLQGQAESGLERLHKCAEKDLAVYLDQEGPSNDFNEFRTKLTGLTTVTRNYFENLVRALENGLADVDSHSACSKTGSSKSPGGGKKGKGGKSKGKTSKSNGDGQSQENHNQDNHSQENQGSWTCEHCTYLNDQPATICLMCNRHHGAWSCGFCTYFNTEAATSCQMCSHIR